MGSVATDDGSIAVAGVGGVLVLMMVTVLGLVVGHHAYTRVQAASTADLAALAAVSSGCEEAQVIVEANSAQMVECIWHDDVVTVHIEQVPRWTPRFVPMDPVRAQGSATLSPQ